ncbi:MAG: hypothetical protein IID40_09155 [Planctomycetes bacterium]|nr:hypothetical protein [Planctomycetota bacterium]
MTDIYAVLDDIWRIKGFDVSAWVKLIELSRGLRAGTNALVFQKVKKRRLHRKAIQATALVEFFCGPEFTYAIAWGVKSDPQGGDAQAVALDPKPVLLRLCPTSLLRSAAPPAGDMGRQLLEPVLAALRNPFTVKDEKYGDQIGLILALDGPLFLMAEEEFTQIRFAERTPYLVKLGDASAQPGPVPWSTLADLRSSDRSCDYQLCRGLKNVERALPAGDERWALQQILAAANPTP